MKSVRSVSFGAVCGCGCCLKIFVFGTATVCFTVFVSGFAIFFASATSILLVPSINSSAAYFVSSSTRSISLRIAFNACCMSCKTLLFILLFSNLQTKVMQNHHHTYPARIDSNIYDDLMKIKDLDNRSINSLFQEGARLVRNQYVEQIAQERKTRTTLQNRYATLK